MSSATIACALPVSASTRNVWIGQGLVDNAAIRFFNGKIDDLRIYNRTLNSSEIEQVMYSTLYKYKSNSYEFIYNNTNVSAYPYTYAAFVNSTEGPGNSTGRKQANVLQMCSAISNPQFYVK